MAQVAYPRLGELIDYLVRAIAGINNWRLGQAVSKVAEQTGYSKAAVYRWRQGRLCPPEEVLEELARIGQEEAELERIWGENMLRAAHYHNVTQLVNRLWGEQETRSILANLPERAHSMFVGRETEMARLLNLLSPAYGTHLISVDGIGGVGKTALVLEMAYRCKDASTGEVPNPDVPTFDAIIFTTAKQQYLTSKGAFALQQAQHTLRDIFIEIARTLGCPEITHSLPEEQPFRVREALSRQRTLLIVDNMETMEEQEEVLSFLYNLPPNIKVIITTRERLFIPPIRLAQLSESEGLRLIDHQAEEKGVSLNQEQALTLYQRVGGVPAAIIYAIGRMSDGDSIKDVLRELTTHHGDIARFCFASSIAPLRGQPAHHLLMAAAIFSRRPLSKALLYTAGLQIDPIAADKGLRRLEQLSLIKQSNGRIGMLPLTREYALAELAACPEFEHEAQERWVKWYLEFTEKYGGDDFEEWHIPYDKMEEELENIGAVLNKCASQERYDDFISLLSQIMWFTDIYGHWHYRLTWLSWAIEQAQRRGDWNHAIRAICHKAFTLIQMGQVHHLEQADLLLKQARAFCSPTDYFWLTLTTMYTVILRVRQKRYDEAENWVNQGFNYLKQFNTESLSYFKLVSNLLYYQAEIHYQNGQYEQAEALYRKDVEVCQKIAWQRGALYAQNWLADVAIAKNQLDKAKYLLHTGLPVAERNKDKRRIACYKRSFAHLKQKQGHLDEAHGWAKDALEGFERLAMCPEIEQMRALVAELGENK